MERQMFLPFQEVLPVVSFFNVSYYMKQSEFMNDQFRAILMQFGGK